MLNVHLTSQEREKFIKLCQAARASIIAGDEAEACLYFRYAAYIHPFSTTVWLGLAKVVATEEDRRVALQNVLAINPQHEEARQLLAELDQQID